MQCICGSQIGNAAFCTNCGRPATAQAQPHVQYQQPTTYQQPSSYQEPYQQAQWQGYQPNSSRASDSNGLSIGAFVLGGIGFFFLPVIFGVAGIIMASVAKSRGERLANAALGVAIAATVLSMIIGFASFSMI